MPLRRITDSHWFALADLFLILGLTAICILTQGVSRWLLLAGLLPQVLRMAAGKAPFRRTPFDLLIAIFLITAWVGYWAAFDRSTAWDKAWWVVAAVLLYFAAAGQPRENLMWVCGLIFLAGIGVSVHYLLSYDFAAAPRKLELVNRIGRWLMGIRPQTGWTAIHPNYAGGLVTLSLPFVIPLLWKWRRSRAFPFLMLLGAAGSGVMLLTLLAATSRGAIMAAAGGLGVVALWQATRAGAVRGRIQEKYFPAFVLIYLCLITAFLYLGPAGRGSIAENYHFGNGSREELFSRSLYLLEDYPITGGGLGSFPGLYSRYILNIPYFNVPNSHNLFLDAALEQGLLGGAAFLVLYLVAIWRTVGALNRKEQDARIFAGVVLMALTAAAIHGLVDDYLYNGRGTLFSLFLPALSIPAVSVREEEPRPRGSNRVAAGVALLVLALVLLSNPKKILATWYADVGSVKMAWVDLKVFPGGGWVGPEVAGRMGEAEAALRASVELDPDNRTANQRLGMIAMLRQDFEAGSDYLFAANRAAPEHRGVIKSLGFCRAWMGDLAGAKEFLSRLPEATEELDAYIWWWGTQGRLDLSANAALALQALQ